MCGGARVPIFQTLARSEKETKWVFAMVDVGRLE